MKTIIVLALALCAVSALHLPDSYVDEEFHRFQRDFHRQYNGVNEQAYRKEIFRENLERIHEHNLDHENGLKSFRLAVNQFADMTNQEYRRKMNGYKPYMKVKKNNSTFVGHNIDGLPDTVDWRTKGVVTAIKNQEQCGSCWAFSAVAGIEGQHALATKKLVSLSEQNLVDCSQAEGNQGCEGGLMDQAFEYVIKNGGIDTETSYPYKAIDEKCEFQKKSVGATVKGFTDVKTGDESALKAASATIGPISVAIDASSFQFQFYSSGVYDDSECGNQMQNLDHGVTVVGYGTQDGKDYWLVKNSWGTVWGEKGYIQMSRNKENQCGIATAASYPTGVH